MAAPTQRRRRRPADGRALTAAATLLPIKSKSQLRRLLTPVADWQREAFDYFDTTPELKYTGWWVGNALSKVKMYAAVEGPDGEAVAIDAFTEDDQGNRVWVVPDVPDAVRAQAVAEMKRLRGSSGGQGELLREIAINLDFAGECYLCGWGAREKVDDPDPRKAKPATPEAWEIRSISEVEFKDGVAFIAGEPNDKDKRPMDPALDTIIRIYQRHPRWSKLADSHVRATITQCRLLQVLEGQILAESMSRHNAGILLVAKNTTWASAKPSDPDDAKTDEDPFAAGLTEMITAPVADPSDPSSVVPNVALVDDVDKAMKWLQLGRDTGEMLDKRIDKRIERLAGGLNVPKEVVLGHRATTFANADQISDDEFTDHLEPRVLLQCDGLTFGYLRPQLIEAGGENEAWADRVFIWYDASALLDPPDQQEAAQSALRNFAIGFPAYRAAMGFSEEDAPTPEEQLGMVGLFRGIFTADLSLALLKLVYPDLVVEPIPPAIDPNDDTAGEPAAVVAGGGELGALISAMGGVDVARMLLHQALGLRVVDDPHQLALGAAPPNPS